MAKEGDTLPNLKIEVQDHAGTIAGHRWGGIFSVAWPSPNWPPNPGDRAMVYAVIPTGSGDQDEGLQLPHAILWAQSILQGLSKKYTGLFLVKVGYLRATSDQPQLCHQGLRLELHSVGVEHALCCFMPKNQHCSMGGGEKMIAYGSGSGVPYPWQEVSMSMLIGDLWTLNIIHCGGAVPREARARSTGIIAVTATATRGVD